MFLSKCAGVHSLFFTDDSGRRRKPSPAHPTGSGTVPWRSSEKNKFLRGAEFTRFQHVKIDSTCKLCGIK